MGNFFTQLNAVAIGYDHLSLIWQERFTEAKPSFWMVAQLVLADWHLRSLQLFMGTVVEFEVEHDLTHNQDH